MSQVREQGGVLCARQGLRGDLEEELTASLFRTVHCGWDVNYRAKAKVLVRRLDRLLQLEPASFAGSVRRTPAGTQYCS